ncbi:MAG TPA: diaminopimelate decarboxylase [Acholeplasmataceae bacterium]|nr:diaminopimelate decarboxylase [Acholeplasmataceae bacterium]
MLTKSMSVVDNNLYIGNHKISDIADKYKTPLMIYDENHIREKLSTFKENFKSDLYQCEVVYASKAFLTPYMCDLINEYNMSIDCVSLGDLYIVKRSGFPMAKVLMHGNNKSEEELIFCIENSVGYIVVDNFEELKTLDELTRKLKKKVNLLFRVNPGIEAHTHDYIKTALLNSKFGESIYDREKIGKMIAICSENQYLNLEGFHSHIGSNISSSRAYIGEIRILSGFIKMISDEYHFKTKVLNLGGGFAIKYTPDDIDIDLKTIINNIIRTVNRDLGRNGLKIDKLMIEPGRSIVGDAGITVYKVGSIKETFGGKKYVFIDGGMSDNIRPALYQAKYTASIANRFYSDEENIYDIAGKLCESGDIIAHDIMLGKVQKDDYLITYATGAYCYPMASNYNSALRPAVVFVKGDNIKVVIKREEYCDLVKNDLITPKVFDIHTDILYDLHTKVKEGEKDRFLYHVKQLQNGPIKGGLWTMYSPDDFDLIEACKTALKEIDLNLLPGFQVILGLEGLRNLQKPEDIEVLYNLGFRHAMLTWNEENKYAGGVKADPNYGLTDQGKKLLSLMEKLDMIIDLAHLNEKSFFDVLGYTQKNIIYSHGNVKEICDHPRNVNTKQMKALKEVDGLLGLTLAGSFVSQNKEERDIDHFIDHIDYAVSVMGIDNVCFGFDFMDYLEEENENLLDLPNATFVSKLLDTMLKRGYTNDDIFKITYDNFYRRYQNKIILRGSK